MSNEKVNAFDRLLAIRNEMDELIYEADTLVRADFKRQYPNASGYWIAHIKSALGNSEYPTYATTFDKFLEEAEEEAFEEE